MARVKFNALINGSSGRIGNIIFKYTRRATYISSRPDRSKVTLSPKQKKSTEHFAKAVEYAKGVSKDPVRIALYAAIEPKPEISLYHAAIKEFMAMMKKPESDSNTSSSVEL
jgi:hypothetical protein